MSISRCRRITTLGRCITNADAASRNGHAVQSVRLSALDFAPCDGCGDCLDACPEDAIEGKPGFIHMLDESMCEKCGMCAEVCPQRAIVAGGKFRVPKKLTRVGKF